VACGNPAMGANGATGGLMAMLPFWLIMFWASKIYGQQLFWSSFLA